MAIVLPDGILTNLTLGFVRKFIQDNARILAIVSLPRETFVPHGTGSKASVVFLQKFGEEVLQELKKKDYPVFMAVCEKIGYDIRGRTLLNEKGEYVSEDGEVVANKEDAAVDSEIADIVGKFKEFKLNNDLKF